MFFINNPLLQKAVRLSARPRVLRDCVLSKATHEMSVKCVVKLGFREEKGFGTSLEKLLWPQSCQLCCTEL